jgi:hypothetical protein
MSIILKTSGSGADGFERMCHHISISPTNNIWSSTVLGSMTLHWFLSQCHSKKPKNLQYSILQQLWSLVSSLKTIVKWLPLVTSDTSRWWSYRWWWWWWWSFQLVLNKIEILAYLTQECQWSYSRFELSSEFLQKLLILKESKRYVIDN